MRISDWSSDVCSSDLAFGVAPRLQRATKNPRLAERGLFVPPEWAFNICPPYRWRFGESQSRKRAFGDDGAWPGGTAEVGPHERIDRSRAAQQRACQDQPPTTGSSYTSTTKKKQRN